MLIQEIDTALAKADSAEYARQAWLRTLRTSGVAIKSVKQLADGSWDLDLTGAAISNLKMLSGAPISILKLGNTAITDLAPLRGMALKQAWLYNTKVTDLSPLAGMPLEHLQVSGTPVTDLTPLRGMGLITLALHGCPQITDLTPPAASCASR